MDIYWGGVKELERCISPIVGGYLVSFTIIVLFLLAAPSSQFLLTPCDIR
jgi:hypothetical protein